MPVQWSLLVYHVLIWLKHHLSCIWNKYIWSIILGILPNILGEYLSRIYLAYILVKYIGQSETASPPLMVLLGDMAPVWPQSLHPVRVLWTEACHQLEKGFPKFYTRPTWVVPGLKSKTDPGTCGCMDRIVWNIWHSILSKIWKHYVPKKTEILSA